VRPFFLFFLSFPGGDGVFRDYGVVAFFLLWLLGASDARDASPLSLFFPLFRGKAECLPHQLHFSFLSLARDVIFEREQGVVF